MKLSSRQVRMLSSLSPNQVDQLGQLSDNQIEILVQLDPKKLEALNQIDEKTLKELSTLDSAKIKQLSKLSSKQVDQLSQLSNDQIETLKQIPPGTDFSKLDLNNLKFDDVVTIFDDVDPDDLPILANDEYYDDYYDDDYTERKLRHIPFMPSKQFFTKNTKTFHRLRFNSIKVSKNVYTQWPI